MNPRPRIFQIVLFLLVPAMLVLAGLIIWSFHVRSIEETYAVPLPAIDKSAEPPPVDTVAAVQPESTNPPPPVNAFHSKTIDEHLARLEAERIAAEKAAAEKAAAEKAEAERLAAEKAAAEKAAADAAAAAPVIPDPPPKKEIHIVYRGLMSRVDGTLLAFIENKTDGSTSHYQEGSTFLYGTIQSIKPRVLTLLSGTNVIEILVNQPSIILEP